ncbi:hypothetical protein BP5796_12270 [Coleophoma crateriformis]|uniref:Apple domain-containing protein n=1 Tax=Coleophoma crateriformis TaxID=565419 RepID=A0A3D8Q9J9_9HELO|nr:hypothetical protein BP5796_12270 [Coleophoma crateriformis]
MLYTKESLVGVLAFSSIAVANPALNKRNQVSTKTVVTTITTSTVVPVPITIDTALSATGVTTLIPGALTLTVSFVPAYVYIETATASTRIFTTVSTTKVRVTVTPTSTSPAKTTESTAPATTTRSTAATASPTINPLTGPYIDHWDGSTFYQSPGSQCLYQAVPSSSMTSMTGNSFQSTDNPTCQTSCQGDSHCHSYSWQPSTHTCNTYTVEFDGLVTASDKSGIYFSDKYGNPGYGHLGTGCNNPSL